MPSRTVSTGPRGPSAGPTTQPHQAEGNHLARGFRLQGGEVLPEARLHYLTLGTPRRDASGRIANAALLLHGTTGTGRSFLEPEVAGELFGPGQPLDASRWYVILPDGLGRGGSTKPSDGLRGRFPRYGYGDVVAAQHLLVTEGLGVSHLRLVLGTSMGGMHAWMWAERWPAMMDGVMPIACLPTAISGRNLLWRRILAEAIRGDPGWEGGAYREPPRQWLRALPLFALMADSPVRLQAQAPTREAAHALFDRMVEAGARELDASDYLQWIESSRDYDPEPALGTIEARLLAVNFADDEINPTSLGVMERLLPRVPRGGFVIVPASEETSGHLSLARAALWRPHLEALLGELPPVP